MSKNVLITGASRGIGAATARSFAKKGYNLFINFNTDRQGARTVADETGATTVQADVSDPKQVGKMITHINSLCSGIDILVNNAGFAQFAMFDALGDDEWHKMLETSLSGAFYCIKGVLPYMISKKNGCIINVSSVWGITGASCEVAYSTAKAGLIGMTKALAKEVGPSGIRVNCVAPGVIDTDMNSTLNSDTIACLEDEIPLGRIGKPEEIAATIAFLADSADYITGQVISPNGGLVI